MSIPDDLDQVKEDIQRAKDWALSHFNVGGPYSLFYRPVHEIEFTDVDRMRVYPTLYGKRMPIGIEYRLKWRNGQIGWEGYGILSGLPMCWLAIPIGAKQD